MTERDQVSETDVAAFAAAIERQFGHQPDARRMDDLRVLLGGRIKAVGVRRYVDYERLLDGDGEWYALAPLLTVPETYFWRLPDHFDALVEDVLPKVIARNAGSRTLRMLSAGCASGEEAYTMRMLLDERFPELQGWRVQIVGVDLSEAALERARAGVYSEWSLRATSAARRRANFTKVGKMWRLNVAPRVGVEFRRENLLTAPTGSDGGYDVIFCRNVLIYFSQAAVRGAVAGLTARLAPEGYLFLGPAESLRGGTEDFALCRSHDVFYYRRKDETMSVPAGEGGDWHERIGHSAGRVAGLKPGKVARDTVPALPAMPQAPVQPEALVVASALTEAGRYGEAEAECRRVLKAEPTNAGAHFLLGLCAEQTGALEAAEKEMTRALYLEPGFAMAHLHRGVIARRKGEGAGAAKSFRAAMQALEGDDEGEARRLELFGGGFSRAGLRQICVRELERLEEAG